MYTTTTLINNYGGVVVAMTLPNNHHNNLLLEVVRLGLDKEISPDGTYLTYFPFGLMIERPRMATYHDKYLLLEWCSSGADTKYGGWDILDVFPIRHID
jgi:hypothetical protein